MLNLDAECRELALMTYNVSIQCRITDGRVTFLAQCYSQPDKAGTEVRMAVACEDTLDKAFYAMIKDLHAQS